MRMALRLTVAAFVCVAMLPSLLRAAEGDEGAAVGAPAVKDPDVKPLCEQLAKFRDDCRKAKGGANCVAGVAATPTGQPVGGVEVAAMTLRDGKLSDVKSGRANPDGTFKLEGLEPGVYTIRADADGYKMGLTAVEVEAGEGGAFAEMRLSPDASGPRAKYGDLRPGCEKPREGVERPEGPPKPGCEKPREEKRCEDKPREKAERGEFAGKVLWVNPAGPMVLLLQVEKGSCTWNDMEGKQVQFALCPENKATNECEKRALGEAKRYLKQIKVGSTISANFRHENGAFYLVDYSRPEGKCHK